MVQSGAVNLPSLPQPLKWEGKVVIEVPDPVLQIAKDLHADRQIIALFFTAVLAVFLFGMIVRRKESK